MTGLWTTSTGWVSTYLLSHFWGRVKMAGVSIADCLSGGVQSNLKDGVTIAGC